MSKELEALERIKDTIKHLDYGFIDKEDSEDFKLIETALKRLEKIDSEIDVNETDFKNTVALYEYFKYNKVSISQLEDMIKKLKALEIIKENLNIDEILLAVKGVCKASDYDLVKEVLL